MIQSSFTDAPAIGVEGMVADQGQRDIVSGLSSSRKLLSIAVGASDSQVYSVTINGTAFTYTADGSATTAEIVVGLKTAINAGDEPVLASGTDTPLLLESTIDGDDGDFTYADSSGSGTLTETELVSQNQGVDFGLFVCLDERATSDVGDVDFPVRLPRQATDITGGRALGVSVVDMAREAGTFEGQTMVPVMRKGRIYVKVEQAVAKGDPVYVRFSASGSQRLGAFRMDADSATAALLPRAAFLTPASANGLAILEINL